MKFIHWAGLFGLGAALASIGDYAHVATATTEYPLELYRFYLGALPYWVPIQFGLATLLIGIAQARWASFGIRPGFVRVGAAFIAFISVYLASAFLSPTLGYAKDGILCMAALGAWAALDRTARGGTIAVAVACVGTAVEVTQVHFGVFRYREESDGLFGVATWLPWIYIVATCAVGTWVRQFCRRRAI